MACSLSHLITVETLPLRHLEASGSKLNSVLAFCILGVSAVHNVIIAYNAKQEIEGQQGSCLEKLRYIWKTLEGLVLSGKVLQIGVADVDEAIFRAIYEWAEIKPSIIQINLATCCVVPPTLQSFCKENDVQLLTHSDPVGK